MTPEEAIAFNTTLREGQTLGILEKPTSVVPTRNDCQNGGVLTCHSRKECNVPSREGPLGPACPVCPKPPTCLEELRVSNERVTELGEALVTESMTPVTVGATPVTVSMAMPAPVLATSR